MKKNTRISCSKLQWLHAETLIFLLITLCFSFFQAQAQTFSYTGAVQTVTLPPGSYEIEMWGADGGGGFHSSLINNGGKGGYSKGILNVASTATYYIYVGGRGQDALGTGAGAVYLGGWNGGGNSGANNYSTVTQYRAGSGGGGTDIRTSQNTTYANRLIVAGGGGGGCYSTSYFGGNGGGLSGEDGGNTYHGDGGTQNVGGTANANGTSNIGGTNGALGTGGNGGSATSKSGGGGGGGGYYGGGGGATGNSSSSQGGGGGGSGYIGGVVNGATFMEGETGFMPNPDLSGNGTVVITSLAPCAGTPIAGVASATSRNCSNTEPFTLSSVGAIRAGGIIYQWQSSPVGTNNWTDIPGATSASHTITSQTIDTDYRFVVTCTHTNTNDVSNVVTVLQLTVLGNFSENFDTTPTGSTSNATYPLCWSYIDEITTTGYGYVEGGGSSQSTPNSFRLYRTNSTTNTSQNLVLISPETDNLGNGTKQLRFSAMALNTNESNLLQIVRSNGATSSSTFTVVQEIVINHTGHQEYIVPLPVTTDDFFGFRLAHNGTTIAVDINIDDVFYEDLSPCIFPMNLGISGITTTGGTISWDASGAAGVTGYEWEVRDINDNVIRSGSTNGVNATTATVSMLTPATDYFLYVRSRCGTSTGIWTSFPVRFQTLCAVFTSIEENFDDTPTGTRSVESYPRCWSYLDEIVTSGYGYVEAATAKSSPNSFRLYRTNSTANSSQNLVLISPETNNLGAGTKRIRFSAMAANTNASNKLQVVRSTGTTSSATYTVLEEIIVDHTNYVEYAVAIPNTTDDYFGFRLAHNGTTSVTDINIDDVYYEDIPPLTVSTSKVDILCFGNGDGSAEAIGEGGVPPYTYSWTPSGATTETINNLSGGQYTVTVTDAWNKTATATVTITEPTQLVSNLVHTPVSCNGQNNGSATVAPSGGVAPYTVLWSDNTIGNTKNNLSPGTYSVTIRDANHCVLTETFTITEPTVLTSVVSSQTNVSAYGGNDGSATITVTGGTAPYTYAWSPSGGTGDSASNLTAGTYTVLITDARGCTTTQTVVITQPAPPYEIVLVSKEDISCNGANDGSITVNVTGGTAPYTYLWSTPLGGNSPSVSNLSPGAYTLTVTDSDNSTLTETFTIIEPAVLTANTTKVDIGCSGQSNGTATVTAAGGTAPYTYLWSNGMTTATATNLQAGSYSVTVTDAKGCTVNASVSITQGSLMTVLGTKTDISCYGANDGSIVLNVTGGSSPYTYSWSNAATSQSIANLIKGTYTVTVTDANNCSETVSFTIVEPTFVHPPVATNQIFCLGQTSQLSDVVITGSNIKWYSSSTGGTLLPATTVLTNGTTYYASQTVGTCESARIGVQITLGQGTPLATTQLNVCSNTRVQNMTVDGFNYTQLKWFDTASSPTPLVASQLLSTKTYYVSSVVGNCESPRQAIQVTVAAAVSVPSASSQTVCGNTTLNDLVVNKDPGATLRWYNSLQSMNPLAGTTVVSSGTYYVQQVVGGCESTRVAVSVQVINVSAPAMTSIATCAGVTVGDFNTASTTYVWYTDATTTTALPTSYVLTTGNYYIAEEVSGCISARANVSVVVNARPASPTGALKQVFNFAATVADLQMVEPNVSWFASYQDALMQVNQLPSNTRLQTGTTYYGILTGTSNCGSLPTAVDVTIDLLGLAELDLAQLKYYPNPVESELNIDYIDEITKVEVFTITGQKVLSKMYNHSEVKVDVSTLSSGTYMVRIETANASQFIKIVKK